MPDYVDLIYDRVITQTEKAVLLAFGDEDVWLPISQIDPQYLPLEEDGGEVGVEFWLVKEKELENYES
jgi:hypothetical protein